MLSMRDVALAYRIMQQRWSERTNDKAVEAKLDSYLPCREMGADLNLKDPSPFYKANASE